ncbi:MAG: HEPN domain-containing protein [bacterium]
MSDKAELRMQLAPMIEKAERSLAAARYCIAAKDHDFASSRAYYAAFYAMDAILATQNLSFSKHAGVIAAFNQQFIKLGIFPKDFSKMIERLFRERQMGDYGYEPSISETDAVEDIRVAQQLINAISDYLVQNSFLEKKE